jgi:hypothetical protein
VGGGWQVCGSKKIGATAEAYSSRPTYPNNIEPTNTPAARIPGQQSSRTIGPMDDAMRFAVRSEGQRSATFRLWVQGSDVYLVSREVGRALKVSLHGSGQWHIKIRQLESELDSVVDNWSRPPPSPRGKTLALSILIPRSAVVVPITPTKRIRWYDLPPAVAGVAFNVVLTPNVEMLLEPPMVLVGSIPLARPERVHVVGETLDQLPDVQLPQPSFRPLRPGDTPEASLQRLREDGNLAGPLKMLAYGDREDGVRWFLDAPVDVRRRVPAQAPP